MAHLFRISPHSPHFVTDGQHLELDRSTFYFNQFITTDLNVFVSSLLFDVFLSTYTAIDIAQSLIFSNDLGRDVLWRAVKVPSFWIYILLTNVSGILPLVFGFFFYCSASFYEFLSCFLFPFRSLHTETIFPTTLSSYSGMFFYILQFLFFCSFAFFLIIFLFFLCLFIQEHENLKR